jgi:uncharacterized membrane protein YgcG
MTQRHKLATEKQQRRAKRKKQEAMDRRSLQEVLQRKRRAQDAKVKMLSVAAMLVIALATLTELALEENASPGWLIQNWKSAAGAAFFLVLMPLLISGYALWARPTAGSGALRSDYVTGADSGSGAYDAGGIDSGGCDTGGADAGGDGSCD